MSIWNTFVGSELNILQLFAVWKFWDLNISSQIPKSCHFLWNHMFPVDQLQFLTNCFSQVLKQERQ